MRLIPTYGPLANSGAAHSFLGGFYAPSPQMSFCHLGHLIRVCANTFRFAQHTARGWACAVAKRRTCAKTPIRRNAKPRQSYFSFFLLPPQPLIALCRNSPEHKEQFSNSGRRQSPKSAQKTLLRTPQPPIPPPSTQSVTAMCSFLPRILCKSKLPAKQNYTPEAKQ